MDTIQTIGFIVIIIAVVIFMAYLIYVDDEGLSLEVQSSYDRAASNDRLAEEIQHQFDSMSTPNIIPLQEEDKVEQNDINLLEEI